MMKEKYRGRADKMNSIAIGFRVSPKKIYYAIVENKEDDYEFISIANLKIPNSFDDPAKLSYIRNTVSTLLIQYKVCYAGIKLIEGNARSSLTNTSIFRFNVEGVLMEIFSNSSIEEYFLGVTSNIASILNVQKDKPHLMLDQLYNTNEQRTDDNKRITDEYKEAMIVALAAMEEGENNE